MEIHYNAIILGLLLSLHHSIGIPFRDEIQDPDETPTYSAPYPERSYFRPSASQRPKNVPIYLPYTPEEMNEFFNGDEGRLAAAAVHNVNLRELFKPLLAASDSSRLTNYIDSVINKFNMRSKKTPPSDPQQKPNRNENVQISLDASLEKFKNKFKSEKLDEKEEAKPKPEPSASSPSTSKTQINIKETVLNKTDAILERLGIITKKTVVKKEGTQTSTEPPMDNAITVYPHKEYSNLKKLHDSATKASTETDEQVSKIIKELEDVTKKNGVKDVVALTEAFNEILTKYESFSESDSKQLDGFFDFLQRTQNDYLAPPEEENGSTKSALFEIEIPFYYPEARMPSFKHIAGATALGALALGAIFASPIGTGLLRRYDKEHHEEEENWLDNFSFWKKDNDSHEEEDQYDVYNTFHDLYNPYYPGTEDVYSESYDDDKVSSDKTYDAYYDNANNNNHYYQESKTDYSGQKDYPNDWYSNHNYNAQPYQYVIPAEPIASVSYGAKPGNSYYQRPFDSKVRAALSVPSAYDTAEPQSFSVGDSYVIEDGSQPSLANERKDYYDYYDQHYGASEKNRYVTVEEVNRIAEESLKQILKNYKTYLTKGIQDAIIEPKTAESSYSSFSTSDYQSEWEPKSPIFKAHASPLVSAKTEGDKKEEPVTTTKLDKEEKSQRATSRAIPARRRKLTRIKDKGEKINQSEATKRDISKRKLEPVEGEMSKLYKRENPKVVNITKQ